MNDVPTDHLMDLRPMPPRERHPKIFSTWAELMQGEAIVLINDHDPVPLYYHFDAEHSGTFRWEYLERGPEVFHVRISKGDFADPGFIPTSPPEHACSNSRSLPIEFVEPLVLDTRPIFAAGEKPCDAIDGAIATLIPGQPLILLVPFEPVPLYAKLEKLGFTHQAKELGANTWQVEFRKSGGCH
jgi:uncharacterized protein (DUF2249 family)